MQQFFHRRVAFSPASATPGRIGHAILIPDEFCSFSASQPEQLRPIFRSATAHQTGVAVPFLDPDVVRYALAIPARWKIRGPQEMEKWPLRESLVDALPDEVIWRGKSKFWEGSGSGETLTNFAEQEISDEVFDAERDLGNEGQLHSKEELMYYRIFREYFGDSIPLTEVGRTQHI